MREKLGANAGRHQEKRGGGHGDEELHLMVKQAAVIQKADHGKSVAPARMPENLRERDIVQRKKHGKDKPEINRDAAKKRNRIDVHFARARLIHHSEAQRAGTESGQ